MDQDDEFLMIRMPSRPDLQIQFDLIDPHGRLVLSVPESQQPRRLSEQQRAKIFSLDFDQLTLRNSDSLRGDVTILVDHIQRTLRRQGHYTWQSGDWAEVIDRSRRFMNVVETYYSAVEALADAIHERVFGDHLATLVRQCCEQEYNAFSWAESIFGAADPESHEALIAWTKREMDERVSQLPQATGDWLAAIYRWGVCDGRSPSGAFEYLIKDIKSLETETTKHFSLSHEHHIAALRLLVGCRPLQLAFSSLLDSTPIEIEPSIMTERHERRYRAVQIAELLHVGKQAVSNWKRRAPDFYPNQAQAKASSWRKFIREAWPCGRYVPEDIPLY